MTAACHTAPLAPRLRGHLRLACERDARGVSILTRKDYRSPIHISKPYWDGQSLLLNVMSPTAGLLEGDQVELDVQTLPGASLVLSHPSSLRVHKMTPTGLARWSQHFRVAAGSLLESNPEWLIPQAESALEQTTRIDVEPGGQLLFIEALAPGRAAHGERLAFRSFRNRLELRYGPQLAALEKHAIEPARQTERGWAFSIEPAPFSASIYAVAEPLDANTSWIEAIESLASPELAIGVSQLAHGPAFNVKLLAADPSVARAAIAAVRQTFYRAAARPCPDLRRS